MCCNGSGFHEAASSVNRKCHCCMAFLFLRLHISCFCTRLGGGAGRAGSARRQGNLDGRCASCDFVTLEAKEPDIHDCFISPKSLGCLVLLSAALKRRRIVGIILALGWRKSVVPALRWRQSLHGRTLQAFLRAIGIVRLL